MRKLTIIVIVFMSINCFADSDSLSVQTSIDSIKVMIREIDRTIAELNEQIQNNMKETDLLKNRIGTTDEKSIQMKQTIDQIRIENKDTKEKIIAIGVDIQTQKDSFDLGISSIKEDFKTTNNEINDRIDNAEIQTQKVSVSLRESVKKNISKFLLICAFLLLISILFYIFSRRNLKQQNLDITEKLKSLRQSLEEEAIRIDAKLIEILEKQINLESKKLSQTEESKTAIDHSLALKVADEIVRIEKNLSRMDVNIKGHKQLKGSVKRIKSNFLSKGYEIVEMVGKKYDTGIKATANFIPDDSLDKNEQIITRIIKPQINYNGSMIQSAQIEVSIGG